MSSGDFVLEALGLQHSLADLSLAVEERIAAATELSELAKDNGEDAIARAAAELSSLLPETAEKRHSVTEYMSVIAERLVALSAPPSEAPVLGLDASDVAVLQLVFKDEASEHLENLTRGILQGSARGLSRSEFDQLMRTTHSLKGSAGTVGLDELSKAAHALEELFGSLRNGSIPWSEQNRERIVFAIDAVRAYTDEIGQDPRSPQTTRAMQDALAQFGEAAAVDAPPPAKDTPPRREGTSVPEEIQAEGTGGVPVPVEVEAASGPLSTRGQVLRVDATRIDRLMDSVGELVFDRTRIERRVQEIRSLASEISQVGSEHQESDLGSSLARIAEALTGASAGLLDDAAALRRTTGALERGVTEVRMLSVDSLFERLAPQVRSIARQLGKKVLLTTRGGDTEFDKAVADQVAQPLIQLIRNALAHGIEDEATRQAQGKPAQGTLTLSARQEGAKVVLEVADDGAGIDPALLRQHFVRSGRWTESRAQLANDSEVLRAIFDAGMTSRDHADEHAGRGVGLDSVRETLAQLGGEIVVVSSPGQGTRFTIRLPLTTALSQAMLFKVGGEVYAIPNAHVAETAHIAAADINQTRELQIRESQVAVLSLHALLSAPAPEGVNTVPAIILTYAGKRVALTCDKLVGPRQIVLKSLGPLLGQLPLYAGGTISGSGKVQLILDPAALIRAAHRPRSTGPRKHILVVDDSTSSRQALVRMLEKQGYLVDSAEDGEFAWELIAAKSYDAIVTDLEMPRLDGFGLIERSRSNNTMSPERIVVVTSRTTDDIRQRANELGVAAFVGKPVKSGALIAGVKSAVDSNA